MMKSTGVFNLILPASELVQDHQPTDNLLQSLGTSTKEVIEMFLNAWSEFKNNDRMFMYDYEEFTQRVNFEVNARLLVMDIIFDSMERRVEQNELPKLTEEDRRAAERVMLSIWQHLSESIFDLLTELHVTDQQIAQMKFVRWIGDDFVISFPRYGTAIQNEITERQQNEHKLEQKRVEQLRASSPLCNHHPDSPNNKSGD